MRKHKPYIHWVVVILISAMALGLAGVAWWYEINRPIDTATTTGANASIPHIMMSDFNFDRDRYIGQEVCLSGTYERYQNSDDGYFLQSPLARGELTVMVLIDPSFDIPSQAIRCQPIDESAIPLCSGDITLCGKMQYDPSLLSHYAIRPLNN